MNTIFCDLCGQQLMEVEVEGTPHLPSVAGEVVMFPQLRRLGGGSIDAYWRCMAEPLLAVDPHGRRRGDEGRCGDRGGRRT